MSGLGTLPSGQCCFTEVNQQSVVQTTKVSTCINGTKEGRDCTKELYSDYSQFVTDSLESPHSEERL